MCSYYLRAATYQCVATIQVNAICRLFMDRSKGLKIDLHDA